MRTGGKAIFFVNDDRCFWLNQPINKVVKTDHDEGSGLGNIKSSQVIRTLFIRSHHGFMFKHFHILLLRIGLNPLTAGCSFI
jgi:hypothetical protein